MTLRLDDEQSSALREAAEDEGRSQQEIVKLALAEYFANRQHVRRRDSLISRVMTEDAELLDRLAK